MSSINDVVTNTNSVIQENLIKLYDKMSKLKSSMIEDEDEEYENFYNRINFYFSSIINELKLNYIESIKSYQQREVEYKAQIQRLKDSLRINEKDIIKLMVDNMTLKVENEFYEEKNLLNTSHYIDVSQPMSDQSINSKEVNNYIRQKKNSKQKNMKKSRNAPSEEISFKTELKTNINTKIQEKLLPSHIFKKNNMINITTTHMNDSLNKKKKNVSNLANFITNANAINNTISNNFQYKSFNNGMTHQKNKSDFIIHTTEIIRPKKQRENLSIEKSMYSLPCYSLNKIQTQENYNKSSLNDLGVKGSSKSKNTSSNNQLRAKSGNCIKKTDQGSNSKTNPNQNNNNNWIGNKSSLNINTIPTTHISNNLNDLDAYKSLMINKINMPNTKNNIANLMLNVQKINPSNKLNLHLHKSNY